MRKLILATIAAISLTVGGALHTDRAQAAPLFNGLQGVAPISNVENVQFFHHFFRHRRYCWYPAGWHGPGWYRCGYEWWYGFGWGGIYGWHGWIVPRQYRRHIIHPIHPRRVAPRPSLRRIVPRPHGRIAAPTFHIFRAPSVGRGGFGGFRGFGRGGFGGFGRGGFGGGRGGFGGGRGGGGGGGRGGGGGGGGHGGGGGGGGGHGR